MRYCRVATEKSGDPKEGLLQDGIEYQVDDLTWYAVRVPPMKEFTAEKILKKRGYAVMCPLLQYRGRINRKVRKQTDLERPLLPGYVLVGFYGPPDWFKFFQIGKTTQIVSGVVSFNNRAAPIPKKSMDWVASMRRTTTVRIIDVKKHQAGHLKPGTTVKVTDGPFAGQMVKIQSTKGASAKVLMKLFNGETLTDISVDNLLKVA